MATGKPAVTAPTIFTSDPIEQTYAKGTLDPQWGGTAFAYLQAAKGDRADAQAQYLSELHNANRLSAYLAQQEDANKLVAEALKQGPEYAKAGLPIEQVPLIARLLTGGGTDPQTREASALVNALKQSQIAENYAKGAAAGQAGAPQYTFEGDATNTGLGNTTLKVRGRDPVAAQAEFNRRMAQHLSDRGVPVTDPNRGVISRVSPTEARQAAQDRARRNHAGVE